MLGKYLVMQCTQVISPNALATVSVLTRGTMFFDSSTRFPVARVRGLSRLLLVLVLIAEVELMQHVVRWARATNPERNENHIAEQRIERGVGLPPIRSEHIHRPAGDWFSPLL